MGGQGFPGRERQRTEPAIRSRTFIYCRTAFGDFVDDKETARIERKREKRNRMLSGRLDTKGGSMNVARFKKSHMFKSA